MVKNLFLIWLVWITSKISLLLTFVNNIRCERVENVAIGGQSAWKDGGMFFLPT
jgi:hypothetical protein